MRFFSTLASLLLLALLAIGGVMEGIIKISPAYNPFAPIDLRAATTFVTPLKLWRLEYSPALCQAALAGAGARFTPAPNRTSANGCSLDNTVLLSSLGGVSLKPAAPQIRCPLAARLVIYANDIGRTAKESLKAGIAQIEHYGTYACRNVYGRANGRLSKHATANAIDISAFTLANGARISVLNDWDRENEKGRFLKEARDGACGLFSAVLGPDYNVAHKNHFHLDGGFFARCS